MLKVNVVLCFTNFRCINETSPATALRIVATDQRDLISPNSGGLAVSSAPSNISAKPISTIAATPGTAFKTLFSFPQASRRAGKTSACSTAVKQAAFPRGLTFPVKVSGVAGTIQTVIKSSRVPGKKVIKICEDISDVRSRNRNRQVV